MVIFEYEYDHLQVKDGMHCQTLLLYNHYKFHPKHEKY